MKLKLRHSVVALAALALVSGAAASAQGFNFVTNPTFSTPNPSVVFWGSVAGGPGSGTVYWTGGQYGYNPLNIPGWTFSPWVSGVSGAGIAEQGSAFGFTAPPSGDGQVAFLQLTAWLSQSITGLTVGDSYDLTFALEGRPSTGAPPTTVTIGLDGALSDVTPANNSWTSYSYIFTAATTSETLMFATSNSPTSDTTTGIDDPSITLVPEGGATLMFLLLAGSACFGAMGFKPRLAG
jgi:hypothetical protein